MRSGILFSFVLGLFICIVEVRGACKCLPKEVKTNSGKMIGNCKSKDFTSSAGKYKGREWCYIKKGDESCCENTTQRFARLCVSYSACGGVTVTEYEEDEEEEEDDYIYPEDYEDDYYEDYEEEEEEE